MAELIFPRAISSEIQKYLFTDDIIVVHGARQVGKTHILYYLQQHLQSNKHLTHYLDLEDSRNVTLLDRGIDEFLSYLRDSNLLHDDRKVFVFIDEIQYLQHPSSFLKLIADHHHNIKLIVSGSSSFAIKTKFKDSLVGRTVNFEVYPLSFEEFLVFRGLPAIINVTSTKKQTEYQALFTEYALYGGYPKIVLTPDVDKKEKYLQQIIDTYIKKDIRDLANVKDIHKFNKLLEVLAAQSGQLLNVVELANTCNIARQTVEHYLFILENTYIIKLLRPFSTNLRSELFKTPKVYFYDTGIMQLLHLKSLQKSVSGYVFETSIFSELIKKYPSDSIYFWRTADGKEIDFILDGTVRIPVEVKWNFTSFRPTAMNYFLDKYKLRHYLIVGIEGKRDADHCVYPWDISSAVAGVSSH